jgi:hypothetical protein
MTIGDNHVAWSTSWMNHVIKKFVQILLNNNYNHENNVLDANDSSSWERI